MTALCDAHIHVVGDTTAYPQEPDRNYTPGIARIGEIERVAAPLGVTRFVIVQPSFYGTDNTLLLETLDALQDRGRGVAVIDPDRVTAEDLAEYAARGVRGVRINLYSTISGRQVRPLNESFTRLADRVAPLGWHVQVIAPAAVLADAADLLGQARVPVVIDHYGLYEVLAPASGTGRRLLALMGLPHVWVKLSAPYRSSADTLALRPDPAWLAAILAAAPDRCVWGSDWPHTPAHERQAGGGIPLPYRHLDYAAVVEAFQSALPSPALAQQVMGRNPARLYGFPP